MQSPAAKPALLALSLVFAAGTTACSATVGDGSTPGKKGPEENSLSGGKADSFFVPTKHGELNFEAPNEAEIQGNRTFHAWDFELDGVAEIDLSIESSTDNFDTVMYLYQRQEEGSSWGSYVAKNDDDGDRLLSRIDGEFESGQYRIIVKPYKMGMTGAFSVEAGCQGGGCPTAEPTQGEPVCRPDEAQSLPARTGFGGSCAEEILEVVTAPVDIENETEVSWDQKCDVNDAHSQALDDYQAFWSDFVDFESHFDYGDGVRAEVRAAETDTGRIIEVNAGGGESAITFVYNDVDELVALHQSNQSPVNDFFCADAAQETSEAPSCFADSLNTLVHHPADTTDATGDTTPEAAGADLPTGVSRAVDHFAEANGLTADTKIVFEATTWEGSFTAGAEVVLEADETTATYWASEDELLAMQVDGSRMYLCE